MKNKLRNIVVNNHKYKWSVTYLDENHVCLKVWDASIKKTPWIEVKYQFDDPWVNFKEMAHATQVEQDAYQTKPITPSTITKIIQSAVSQLGKPSENMVCTHYVLTVDGELKSNKFNGRKMTHEEYLQLQNERVVETAKKLLNNKIGIIEGARILSSLRHDITDETERLDPDFVLFVGIDSETDSLPVGKERRNWAAYALVEKDKEIQQAEDFYRDKVMAACKVLIDRFSE